MTGRLAGKVAMVTGAARGLGRAISEAFASEGADLVLVDICSDVAGVNYSLGTSSQLRYTHELCEGVGASVLSLVSDIRDMHSVQLAWRQALDRFDKVDILVNNAGIAAPSGKPVHAIDETEWALMLDVDLTGAWRMIHCGATQMLSRHSGSIINISSTAGRVGYRNFAAYVTAKHGLLGLTKAAALDFAPMQVRVNAICPGSIRDEPGLDGRMLSEIARSLAVDVVDHEVLFIKDQPMNSLVNAIDVASACVWLASDESASVTGTTLTVDGGYSAR